MSIISKLKSLGYSTVDESFYSHIDAWESWYKGKVEGFHSYRRYNGREWTRCSRASLEMAKKVCEDWANLLMNEKVNITLEGQREQEFVDSVFENNNFWVKSNELQELAFALGTGAIVPRVVGAVESGGAERIALDYVNANNIFPISWENGIITECAFSNYFSKNGSGYCYLQIHKRDANSLYLIENRVFSFTNNFLGAELTPAEVTELLNIPPVVNTGSIERQFVIDRPNIANNIDLSSSMGISVYANALDVLVGVDKAYDCYCNEFDNGALLLMVKMPATDYIDGHPTISSADNRFYLLPEDSNEGNIVEAISPTLRTAELNTGVQDMLNLLSSKCGFGETYYRFNGGSVATATQVVSENSTLFRTIKKHEIILESVLIELCRIILRLGNTAMNAGLNEDVEISIDFDDSIIEDEASDFARDMQLLNAGILNDWEFRAKWLNEDESTAKAALPKMADLTTEGQNEVE